MLGLLAGVRHSRILMAALISGWIIGSSTALAEPRVATQDLKCLLENSHVYLESARDPIIVLLKECPNPNPSSSNLMKYMTNYRAPKRPGLTDEATVSDILVLQKSELHCIISKFEAGELQGLLTDEIIDLQDLC